MDAHVAFNARVVRVLLGGNWNSSKKHLDKRRWVLCERDELFYFMPFDNVDEEDLQLPPLPSAKWSPAECQQNMHKMLAHRNPGWVNNTYQTARNAASLRARMSSFNGTLEAAPLNVEDPLLRPGLRPRSNAGGSQPLSEQACSNQLLISLS
eukprot:6189481-Pleurochrysis_carterae.AAC.4